MPPKTRTEQSQSDPPQTDPPQPDPPGSPEGVAVDVPLLEEAVPQVSAQDLHDATDSVKNYMFFAGQEISHTVSQTMSQSIEPLTLAINNMIATINNMSQSIEPLTEEPNQDFI